MDRLIWRLIKAQVDYIKENKKIPVIQMDRT